MIHFEYSLLYTFRQTNTCLRLFIIIIIIIIIINAKNRSSDYNGIQC
jgi:hypothetical protein